MLRDFSNILGDVDILGGLIEYFKILGYVSILVDSILLNSTTRSLNID